MINKKIRHKTQRTIKRWAERHKEEIYDKLGRVCNKCRVTEDLSIHHKEYKKDLKYLEILCQKCHRDFHEKETRKRLLIYCLEEVKKFKGYSVKDLKEWLREKRDAIPVKIIPNIKMDGFEK